jgi:uncharacterized protein (TIGR02246 family)
VTTGSEEVVAPEKIACLIARAEIADLIVTYCQAFDDQDWKSFARLWTDDATFSVDGRSFTGKSEVMDFLTTCLPPGYVSKHMLSQPLIRVADDLRTATAQTDVVWIAADFTNAIVGRYDDELSREDGCWKFRRREEIPVPYREGPAPMSEAAQTVSGKTMHKSLLRER